MCDLQERLQRNVAALRERIAQAARDAGRTPESIRLVGVSKYVGVDEAAALVAAGLTDLGESRPQQLWDKASDPRLAEVAWHFIGHLQRNKVRRTLPSIAWIHSLDSERLLDAIEEAAREATRPVRGLIEVNCSGEQQKGGVAPAAVGALYAQRSARWPHVEIVGLMTMAARAGGATTARENFADLRVLRDRLRTELGDPEALPELSMGMSGDFEEAIAEGATIVRVGSSLWEGIA